MAITWITPAGNLGLVIERNILSIPLEATSTVGDVTFSLIAGNLPTGLRLDNGVIKGSPVEVRKFTDSRFVIRASDGISVLDRTFGISVDGADLPRWLTPEGFLNVGPGDAYFVLDNAHVDFQLSATDTDLTAGESLEYYIVPSGGELPPGLSLSKDGRISGFTDPIFAVNFNNSASGSYDAQAFDILPLDKAESKSNGFDTFLYDNTTFDYNEPSQSPKRVSRFYSFVVGVSDGINEVRRLFRIYVVTEEFLQADNSIVQVDTNIFQADSSSDRKPLWITDSNLGRYRANNYITLYLDVYDPPSLTGLITYLLLPTNPDLSASILPPGMTLDQSTGEIAGRVPYQSAVSKSYQFTLQAINFPPTLSTSGYNVLGDWNTYTIYQVNDVVKFLNLLYVCVKIHRNQTPQNNEEYWTLGVSSAEKTFNLEIIGEIESSIEWVSDSDLGTIKPNQPSRLFVKANSLFYGGRTSYEFVSGTLPPGLTLLSTGVIEGKVKQFADATSSGLTRFVDRDSSLSDSVGSFSYNTTFDGSSTSFDKKYTFLIKARDGANFAESIKEFSVTVVADNTKTFANLYLKAFQTKEKRLEWFDFITNANIFRSTELYRYGDPNFGIQTELKTLVFAGIESVEAVKYVQAMSRNHYRKQLKFGNIKSAEAKDPNTQETIYEVVYIDVIDDLEKNGTSVQSTVLLANNINSKVLVSYDAISIDSDIPLVSDSDHQRIFPNSIKNMRSRIRAVGERDREFLPLWMRSIQSNNFVETGFVKALVLCYCNPGTSAGIIARIKASEYDFKSLNFTADRYLIDVLDGEIENKYLAFPQRGEKLP
jgi:hypothetical protein